VLGHALLDLIFLPTVTMELVVYLLLLVVAAIFLATFLLPGSYAIRRTAQIGADAERVFAALTDLEQAPRIYPGIQRAERLGGKDGPARRQRLIHAGGQGGGTHATVQQVTTWVPGSQYGYKVVQRETGAGAVTGGGEARVVFSLQQRGVVTEVEAVSEWSAGAFWDRWSATLRGKRLQEAELQAILTNLANQFS
jgi:carbon monoxide dehydrogenase subunit G